MSSEVQKYIEKALDKNNVGKQERDEVLVILYSMKGEIAHV